MATFNIQFEDPLAEVIGGAKIKPNWDPGSWGDVSVTEKGVTITGSSRLSTVERWLSAGVLGEIFVKTFFQSLRHRTQNYTPADIVSVAVATRSPQRASFLDVGKPATDIVHIFAARADKDQEILSFSFYTPSAVLVSRPALWLFWGFLTRLLPSSKLELYSEELRQEVNPVAGQDLHGEEMQHRIATAFFRSLKPPSSSWSNQPLLDKASDLYSELFGTAGCLPAQTMLSTEDWVIRAVAVSCLSKITEGVDTDTLLPLLRDNHPLVRLATVNALAKIPSAGARQGLQDALQDADKNVKRAAQDALKRIANTG